MIEMHTETAWELDPEELQRWDEAIAQNSRAWDEAIGLTDTTDNGSHND